MTDAPAVLDSNIYIYALNKGSAKHKVAYQLLNEALLRKLSVFVTHQNLNEIFNVITDTSRLTKPFKADEALREITTLYQALPLIVPNEKTFSVLSLSISQIALKSRRIFDAFLAATMISNGIEILYTDNEKDFKKYKEIKVINPFQ